VDSSEAQPIPAAAGDDVEQVQFNESRWPPAAAVFVFLIFNITVRIWLPKEPVVVIPWLLPTLEAAILGILVFGRPGDLARRRR
jgi:hypothetical protein